MKRIILLAAALMLTSCASNSADVSIQTFSPQPAHEVYKPLTKSDSEISNKYKPLNFSEQKAVWISYIDLADMLTGKTKEEFQQNFETACKNISSLGCNTIYAHVRAFGDAYYDSDIFPTSKGVTGTFGNSADFDPLSVMVEQAHQYGLSIHAWVNPLRCETAENILSADDDYLIKTWLQNEDKYSEYIVQLDDDIHCWLNPSKQEVRDLISAGVAEIAENYNADGIHIDDYFYPTTEKSFDGESYAAAYTTMGLDDWRMENCSQMVSEMYSAVKSVNSDVLFGISPQGNIDNNYVYMFADVERWLSQKGYADYIVPQLYFGYDNSVLPFSSALEDWCSIDRCQDVSLVIGIAPYKIGEESDFSDNEGILSQQINDSTKNQCNGVALYSYSSLFQDSERMSNEREMIEEALS